MSPEQSRRTYRPYRLLLLAFCLSLSTAACYTASHPVRGPWLDRARARTGCKSLQVVRSVNAKDRDHQVRHTAEGCGIRLEFLCMQDKDVFQPMAIRNGKTILFIGVGTERYDTLAASCQKVDEKRVPKPAAKASAPAASPKVLARR